MMTTDLSVLLLFTVAVSSEILPGRGSPGEGEKGRRRTTSDGVEPGVRSKQVPQISRKRSSTRTHIHTQNSYRDLLNDSPLHIQESEPK